MTGENTDGEAGLDCLEMFANKRKVKDGIKLFLFQPLCHIYLIY